MNDNEIGAQELARENAHLRARVAELEAQLTAERSVAEALRVSERTYRLLADNSRDVIWMLDTDLRFTYVSPSIRRLRGIDPDEVLDAPLAETLPPETARVVMDLVNQRLPHLSPADQDDPVVLEFEHQHRDGTPLWIEVVVQFVFDEAGEWAGLVGVSRDTTARRAAEQALRESESRYRLLAETAGDIILVHDLQGNISYINHAGLELSGYSEADILGLNLRDLIPTFENERMGERARLRREGDTSRYIYEATFTSKSGEIAPLEVASQPLQAEGRPEAILIVARDTSRRRELEAQLNYAQKMETLGQLAGGVAHDFNNLLTTITGYSEFVRERLPDGDPACEDIEHVIHATERASRLTRQLLAFSRRQVMKPALVRLDELAIEMAKMLRRLIGTDIELVFLPGEAGAVHADLTQLEQVIINLAVNARDAMPNGGKLFFETGNASAPANMPAGSYALLSVRDTGVGMSSEVLKHLFEPFFTTKDTGTGLGLSTVYGIIKQHGGDIRVRSTPGTGTTFDIYLPHLAEDETTAPRGAQSPPQPPTGDETILLAEDEPSVRRMTVRMLESLGYRVLAAGNGSEALRLAGEHGAAIDLLLTDLVMPQMNGSDLAARLLEMLPTCRVLFLSGYADDALVKDIAVIRSLPFLEKPYTSWTLARKVRQVLDAAPAA